MSQTGYYSLDGGVWRFQGTPRYLLEHMGRLTFCLVYQCTNSTYPVLSNKNHQLRWIVHPRIEQK